jgi:HK97 family phage portal protein
MLGRLVGLETRGSYQALWGSGALFERPTASGIAVSQDTSLQLSAVYACVRLISDTISTLPVDQYQRLGGTRRPYRPREAWIQRPNSLHDRVTFYQQVVTSLLLDGNAFIHVMRDDEGVVFELDVLNPTQVEPLMANGQVAYRYTGQDRELVLTRDNVLHITELLLPGQLRGVSRITANKENLALAMALQQFAATFFGNSAYPGGLIEIPGEPSNGDQLQQMIDQWESHHRGIRRSHRPAVLYGGAKFVPTSVNPSDSQLLQERIFAVEEVARLFRVPLFALGVAVPGAVSYASVEQQQLHFLTHTIQPLVSHLEEAFSSLLSNPNTFIRFNLSSLVRADLATRTQAYSTALAAGYMSVNDVRSLEDMAPAGPDGDAYRVPLQNIPITDAPVITLNERAKALSLLVTSGFTPESAAAVVGIDGLEHTGLASVQLQPEMNDDGTVQAG